MLLSKEGAHRSATMRNQFRSSYVTNDCDAERSSSSTVKTMSPGQFGIVLIPAACAVLMMCAATAFAGAGVGVQQVARLILSPVSIYENLEILGIAFWGGVGVLLALRGYPLCRWLAGAALLAHYGGVILLGNRENWVYLARAWQAVPGLMAALLSLYLISQMVFWAILFGWQKTARPTARKSPAFVHAVRVKDKKQKDK